MTLIRNCFPFSEPFLEAIPQVVITMIFSTRIFLLMLHGSEIHSHICSSDDYAWLPIHKQILINFSVSVLSGSLGLSKLLKAGPCRLVPYDQMSFGFLALVIINASCIIAKGLILTLVLLFGTITTYGLTDFTFNQSIALWIVICILPHMFFVSIHINYSINSN